MSPKYLPNFTAFYISHQVCTPPHPQCGELRHPLTVEPNKKGARVPDFLQLPGPPYHLRCFHSSAVLLCRFIVMQLLWLHNTEACHLCCCFRSNAILHKAFPIALLLSWSACLAEGPGPCYLCTLIIGASNSTAKQSIKMSTFQKARVQTQLFRDSDIADALFRQSENLDECIRNSNLKHYHSETRVWFIWNGEATYIFSFLHKDI